VFFGPTLFVQAWELKSELNSSDWCLP